MKTLDVPVMDTVRVIFEKCENSSFLKGETDNPWFGFGFDWIFRNDSNWVKIYEGNYDDKTGSVKNTGQSHQDRVKNIINISKNKKL